MSWKQEVDKPLILVEATSLQEVVDKTGYEPDDSAKPLYDSQLDPESYLQKLAEKELYLQAVTFLAYAIHRRAGVWWAWQCVRQTTEEVHRVAAAQMAGEAEAKESGQTPEMSEELAAGKQGAKKQAMPVEGASPESQPQDEEMIEVNNFLIPKSAFPNGIPNPADQPMPKAMQDFATMRDNLPSILGPEKYAEFQQQCEKVERVFASRFGMSIQEWVMQYFNFSMTPTQTPSLKVPPPPRKPRRPNVPKPNLPSFLVNRLDKSELDSKRQAAMEAAKRWILVPNDDTARTAMTAGKKLASKPEGMVALAAFWSGANLSPVGKPSIAPPPGLGPRGVFVSMQLSSARRGGEKDADARLKDYLAVGLDVARGLNTWDTLPAETAGGESWNIHKGFARSEQPPTRGNQ